jgi:hypothetical protein
MGRATKAHRRLCSACAPISLCRAHTPFSKTSCALMLLTNKTRGSNFTRPVCCSYSRSHRWCGLMWPYGLDQGISQGERQVHDLDGSGSLHEVRPFHPPRPPLHGDHGGTRLIHRHCPPPQHPKLNHQRQRPNVYKQFLAKLFSLSDGRLHITTFHPQSSGQSEAVNKIITMYLCCLIDDHPQHWIQWLSWTELCYNSAFQSSPLSFRIVYERNPPTLHTYTQETTCVPAVNQQLADRDEFLAEICNRLEEALQYYKSF